MGKCIGVILLLTLNLDGFTQANVDSLVLDIQRKCQFIRSGAVLDSEQTYYYDWDKDSVIQVNENEEVGDGFPNGSAFFSVSKKIYFMNNDKAINLISIEEYTEDMVDFSFESRLREYYFSKNELIFLSEYVDRSVGYVSDYDRSYLNRIYLDENIIIQKLSIEIVENKEIDFNDIPDDLFNRGYIAITEFSDINAVISNYSTFYPRWEAR